MSIHLGFPPLSGGIQQGLNDPGIETFAGDHSRYVVRECVQNSLDAVDVGPVKVAISLHSLDPDDLPFLGELQASLDACRSYWATDEKAQEFFKRAKRAVGGGEIMALRISDSGTKGVAGGDDLTDSPWYGLVKSRGVSVQSNAGSAGAFGIGKDAPLAASAVRTTIYSTRTKDGEVAFQGISRLATHDLNGDLTQGTGFIGTEPGADLVYRAIRDESAIPDRFLRAEPGLDVWILAIRDEIEGWERDYICSALENFWPAIHLGRLEMKIGSTSVDQATICDLMHRFRTSHPKVAEAEQFHRSMVDPDAVVHRAELPHAGNCELHISKGRAQSARSVCLTRATGMVIDNYSPRTLRVPYAGLFTCTSEIGNERLKALEPPRHDKWQAKRATDPAQSKALSEIRAWIRECLQELVPDADSEEVNVEELAKILPDEMPPDVDPGDEGESDLGGRPTGTDQGKSLGKVIPGVAVKGKGAGPDPDSDGTGAGDEGDTESGDEGDGKNTGGRRGLRGGSDKGGGGRKPKRNFHVRSVPSKTEEGPLCLVVRSEQPYEGDLLVEELTEEGMASDLALAEATAADGSTLEVEGNRIKAVSVPGDSVPLTVNIIPKEDIDRAVRIRSI